MSTRVSSLLSPLKIRHFRLLWLAQAFSELGDWAARLALAVIVAERTGSTLLTALVTTSSVVPFIGIGQLLAAYANRFPRRTTIIVTDLGRAGLFAILVIPMPAWLILILAFLAGCLTPPFEAARGGLTPLLVPRDQYGDAVALMNVTFDAAVLIGYGGGGALLAIIGARTALLLNAMSFVVSAALLTRIPAASQGFDDNEDHVRVRDAWHTCVDDPFIRRFLVGFTIVGACAVVSESLVALYAIQVLMKSASVSGLLAAAIPLGAIIATVAGRSRGSDTAKLRRASELALVGSVIGIMLFAVNPDIPLVLLAFAAIGSLNASRIPANEVAVLRMDDRMRGPAISLLSGFMLGSQALAAALGGLIARSLGVRETIVLSLVVSGLAGVWGTLRPPHELRHAARASTTPR